MDMSSSDEETAAPAQSMGAKTALSTGTKDMNG